MTRKILAILSAVAFCGTAQTPQERRPVFISPEHLPVASILHSPPGDDSKQTLAEFAELHRLQETRTPEDVARAQQDDTQEDIFIFANVLGAKFARTALPSTAALSDRLRNDAGIIVQDAKLHFSRPRPFMLDATIKPVCKLDNPPKPDAYPSGHATVGYVEGLVLALLVPEKRDLILARADDYAHNRLVCGVHHPTDLIASKETACAIVGALLGNAEFLKELALARTETRKALDLN